MTRFFLIYSVAIAIAGSSLLAELPPSSEGSPTESATGTATEVQPTLRRTSSTSGNPLPVSRASRQERLKQLQTKQEELQSLQREVADLQRQLAVASQYQVDCVMGEVMLKKLQSLNPEIQSGEQTLSVAALFNSSQKLQSINTVQFQAVRHCLQATHTMKVLMEPTIITSANLPASISSGGAFPVLPASGEDGTKTEDATDWRKFGINFETAVQPLGDGRVRVKVCPEVSERDFKNAVKVNGQNVPGIRSLAFAFEAEMNVGETALFNTGLQKDSDPDTSVFVAVTVQEVNELEPVVGRVQLEPIPETPSR